MSEKLKKTNFCMKLRTAGKQWKLIVNSYEIVLFSVSLIFTCVIILKQFSSGSVNIGEYLPRLRLGKYSLRLRRIIVNYLRDDLIPVETHEGSWNFIV
jgi:hypothetical protein